MRLIKHQIKNTETGEVTTFPVFQLDDNSRYCTNIGLVSALETTIQAIRNAIYYNSDWLNPLSIRNLDAKTQEFLRSIKEELGLQRLRQDTVIWPLREALKVTLCVKTKAARVVHDAAVDLLLQAPSGPEITLEEFNALERRAAGYDQMVTKCELVSAERDNLKEENMSVHHQLREHEARISTMESYVDSLKEEVRSVFPYLDTAASAAGSALAAQKKIKAIKGIN